MPTTFFHLPREIRDQIYEYVVVSPTNYISPVLLSRTPTKEYVRHGHPALTTTSNQPRFLLRVASPTKPPKGRSSDIKSTKSLKNEYLTLSLLRTNKQIYNEASPLFWSRTTFYFPIIHLNPHAKSSTHELETIGAIRTLKSMTQIPSRLIVSVSLHMPPLFKTQAFPKLLQVLRSRARQGRFSKLELVWGRKEIEDLNAAREEFRVGVGSWRTVGWEGLVVALYGAAEGCRFERVVRLEGVLVGEERFDGVAREIGIAFGGKVFLGGVLGWEGGKRVGG